MDLKIIEGEKPKKAQDTKAITVNMKGVLHAERNAGAEDTETSDSQD